MENNKIKIAVLGAGISGLATAYWLSKNEKYDVTVYDINEKPGGAMTTKKAGDFLIDFGPNSGLETTPLIRELAEEVGMGDQMIYANEESNKRYILRYNKLHSLPTGPGAFITSSLFTLKGKLRLFLEPFIPRKIDGEDESVYDFVKRRLGNEFADFAIDPFVSGVYAGDPTRLCVKSAFPKVYRLEQKYGGLIKGMIKGARERKRSKEKAKSHAKMFSFINGMQTFPEAIAKKLGDRVKLNVDTENIIKGEAGGYTLLYTDNGKQGQADYDIIISTLPAHKVGDLLIDIDNSVKEHIRGLIYPKVKVLFVVFKKEHIKQPLDGFGFLIPTLESKRFLGAIWSSVIFPNRAPEDYAAFTLFVGGAKDQPYERLDDTEIRRLVLAEFKEIMGIEEPFVYMEEKLWTKAIPQYNLGYPKIEEEFVKFEDMNKGILLAGNYRGGISVGDCVKYSMAVKERVDKLVDEGHIKPVN